MDMLSDIAARICRLPKYKAENVYGFAATSDGRFVFLPPRVTRYLQEQSAGEGDAVTLTVIPSRDARNEYRAVRVVSVKKWEEE